MHTPRTIRQRYYAIVLLYNTSAALIWGVNTLFLLDAGLDLFETFVANAFFTAGMVVFEIPTGVAADTIGRRFSFLMSLAILSLSTLAYVGLAHYAFDSGTARLVAFSIASVFLGLGFTFYSGAVEAWLVDALAAVGDKGRLDTVFARGGQMFGISMLVGTIGGGFLGQVHLSLPYLVRTGLLAALFVVAFRGMHDIGFTQRRFRWKEVPREMRRITRLSIEHGWTRRSVRLLMLMNLLFMGFLIWGWYAWQPYFLALLGKDLVWVAGVIAAGLATTMIAGAQLATMLTKVMRRSTAMAAMAAMFAVAMVVTGLTGNFWVAVGAFLVGMMGFSTLEPMRNAALHSVIPSETRASVVSFSSLMGSAGGVVSQPALGAYTRAVGIGPGYIVGGIITAPAILLALLLRGHKDADAAPDDDLANVRDVLPGATPGSGD